jgi:hypothetical protein
VDLRDLWRGGLSLRRLSILVENMPADSSVWAVLNGVERGWTLTDFLLADVFHALSGAPHPSRPKPKRKASEDVVSRLLAQRERDRARKEAS